MQREVIVVGAGPGGATAATMLAQKGYDVLLLDRAIFPRDKVCGDAIPGRALDLLRALGMGDEIEAANFYYIDKLRLVSPQGHVMDAALISDDSASHSAIVPRMTFDVMLQRHAVSAGAEFCQAQVKGAIVEEGQVVGVRARIGKETKELRSKLVIAADGATSVLARGLRPEEHRDHHRAVALRAYAANIEVLPRRVEFYLYDEILPGYAWIFPLGDGEANIGIGMRLDTFREGKHDLRKLLDRFLEMPDIKKRVQKSQLEDIASWQLGLGSQKGMQRAYDGALLVGDAAGLINPLTGGGIGNAVNSGWLAALVTQEAFLKEDFSRETLGVYDTYCDNYLWPSLFRAYLMQRVMEYFPAGVDWLVRRAQHDSSFARMFMTKL